MMKRTRFVLGLILIIALVAIASAETDPAKPDTSKVDTSGGISVDGIPSTYLLSTMNTHGVAAEVATPSSTTGTITKYWDGTTFYQKLGLYNYVALPVPSMGASGSSASLARYAYLNVYQGRAAKVVTIYIMDGDVLEYQYSPNTVGGGNRYYTIDMGSFKQFTRGAVIYVQVQGTSATTVDNKFRFINGGMQFWW